MMSHGSEPRLPASVLMPLRLDNDAWSLHEGLLWATDSTTSPQSFAQGLVRDLRLPDDAATAISKALTKQIAQFRYIWERKRMQLATSAPGPQLKVFELEVPLRNVLLRDCFEWDINNLENSPERFAEVLAQDVGLTREHEVLVAHAIRTKLFAFWEASLDEAAAMAELGGGSSNNNSTSGTAERSRRKSAATTPATPAAAAATVSMLRVDDTDKWCPRVEQLAGDSRDVLSSTPASTSKRQSRYGERGSRSTAKKRGRYDEDDDEDDDDDDGDDDEGDMDGDDGDGDADDGGSFDDE